MFTLQKLVCYSYHSVYAEEHCYIPKGNIIFITSELVKVKNNLNDKIVDLLEIIEIKITS